MLITATAGTSGGIALSTHAVWLASLFFLASTLAASVDIACGGLAVEQLDSDQRGWGNVAKVGGGYIGMLFGGSAFLLLADHYGWPLALGASGITIALVTLPLLMMSEKVSSQHNDSLSRPSLMQSWRSPEVRYGLLLALILGAGVRTAVGMTGPLLLDKGASMVELAWLLGAFSVGAGIVGTTLGGVLARRMSDWHAVCLAVALQSLVLGLLALGTQNLPLRGTVMLVGLLFGVMAAGFVTIYSTLMGLTSPSQPGVDFALFQCTEALIATAGGIFGGWMAQHFGYVACFSLAATMAAGAALFVCSHKPPGRSTQ